MIASKIRNYPQLYSRFFGDVDRMALGQADRGDEREADNDR
jgi:hypothetical protein